jgi:hypothetical protein
VSNCDVASLPSALLLLPQPQPLLLLPPPPLLLLPPPPL